MTDQTNTSAEEKIISVTPSAVSEIKRLLAEETDQDAFLRIGVTKGGCSGFSYAMEFDTNILPLDREFDFDGLKVRVDLKVLMYLNGTTIDYQGGLKGSGFTFSNPNAKRSCGCGSSFSC